MKIQYLYWEGCESYKKGLERLFRVLEEKHIKNDVEVIKIGTEKEARRWNFIGSPTILIDDEDIDPGGGEGHNPSLTCRVYRWEDGRFSPLPSEQMIKNALKK